MATTTITLKNGQTITGTDARDGQLITTIVVNGKRTAVFKHDIATYIETRTQEDAIEAGWTCKWRDEPFVYGEVFACQGDLYCWTCALELDLMGGNVVQALPTREQVADDARWAAQGISNR